MGARPSCCENAAPPGPNRPDGAGRKGTPTSGQSPGGGRHRCAKRSERRVPRSRPDDAERRDPGREANHPPTRGPSLPPRLRRAVPTRGRRSLACASLCMVAWGRDWHRPENCIFMPAGCAGGPDHVGFSRWGQSSRWGRGARLTWRVREEPGVPWPTAPSRGRASPHDCIFTATGPHGFHHRLLMRVISYRSAREWAGR